jgi:hypothetical protein
MMATMDMHRAAPVTMPWWTLPARLLDRVRPGLAERAADDAAWLARFPGVAVLLPALVAAIPLVFAGLRAFDTTQVNQVVYTFRIQDVYTESIPYMAIGAVIGMAAPALGILFLTAHVFGDLAAAFVQPKELSPLPTALLGRFVSFWVLYLLVAELPVAVHEISAAVRRRLAGPSGRLAAIAAGAGASAVLAYAWGIGATLFIRPVFTWSDLQFPTGNAGWPLLAASEVFGLIVGAGTLIAFTLRYMLRPARLESTPASQAREGAGLRSLAMGVGLPVLLFSSVVTQPIDAVILLVAVLASRPISALVLGRAGLAAPLSIIPRPARLILGFVVSAVVGTVILAIVGKPQISAFFTMVIIIAVSYVLTRLMLDADDFSTAAAPALPLATALTLSTLAGLAIWLLAAGAVLADNITSQSDMEKAAAAAAAAAGGLGAVSAAKMGGKGGGAAAKKPNPPPWYVPDQAADFFGYDKPSPPPDQASTANKKKTPDWAKRPPAPPPGQDW